MHRVGVVGEVAEGYVKVSLEPHPACEGCGMCMGNRPQRVVVSAMDLLGARVGDTVEVDIEPIRSLQAAFVVYMLPLLLLLLGICIGGAVLPSGGNREIRMALMGLGAVSLGFVGMRRLDKALAEKGRLALKVTSIISRCERVSDTDGTESR